jgi:hypothetical protein
MTTAPLRGGLRAYARHRKAAGLPGHTHRAVQQAIDSGRLTDAAREIDGELVIDFAVADREWEARTDPTRQTRAARREDAQAATTRRLHFRALTLERKCRDLQSQLVDAPDMFDEVHASIDEIAGAVTAITDRWVRRCARLPREARAVVREILSEALEPLQKLRAAWPLSRVERMRSAGDVILAAVDEAPPSNALTLPDVAAREKFWHARLAEIEYYRLTDRLLVAADVIASMAEVFSELRTTVLGVPSKVKQRLPHLTLNDLATLEELVRDALEELANPKPEAKEPA